MTAIDRASAYLAISAEYGGNLGGLAWSSSGDAIERWNGTTFAFADEIHEVLAGAFARPPVPPFDFVLALLLVLRDGPEGSSVELDRLWRAHTAAKGAVNLLRHAGRLISELCSTLPPCANSPAFHDVAAAIGSRSPAPEWRIEATPLSRIEFERRIQARLAEYDETRLLHWLKNGCEPLRAAEQLAEPLETLPVRVAKLLTEIRLQPRLAGAAMLVPALDGALTFPARRRSPDAVPQGGYCDVTTRGEPERLLPSQFVLDRDEFVRRFAAHELLYFHREEPHAVRKPERLIVLDQGVRTWGGVRLALAAAALVLMKKDAKRIGRVMFATTSSPNPVDVLEATIESLTSSLEFSDLTAHPGQCLATALASSDDSRDVVLLSHPRALRETAVQKALEARVDQDRVFALTVDERGAAELVHWKETGPESVRRFRVDLAAAEAVRPEEKQPRPSASLEAGGWTGDIEPVPFPFRPGLVLVPEMLAFDLDGEWLVAVSQGGIVQAVAIDDTLAEVLPRAFRNGAVLRAVEAVLSVPGGVAVCGRYFPTLPSEYSNDAEHRHRVSARSASDLPPPERFIVAHYDRLKRTVTAFDLGPASAPARWSAFPDLNCVALVLPDGRSSSVDLASRGVCIGPVALSSGASPRAVRARHFAKSSFGSPPFTLAIRNSGLPAPTDEAPHLMIVANGLVLNAAAGGRGERLMPMRDGKSLLEGAEIHQAQAARDTLALTLKRSGERMLVLMARSENRILGELNLASSMERFALSPDGQTIAHIRPFRTLAISPVNDVGSPRVEVKPAALHTSLAITIRSDGGARLIVRIGAFEHVFAYRFGALEHWYVEKDKEAERPPTSPGTVLHLPTAYDLSRFPPREIAHQHGWRAVMDRLGQVLLYRHDGQLVASFLIRRERAAVWLPGGVFWGDPLLIGGPATPHAAEAIGSALRKEVSQ